MTVEGASRDYDALGEAKRLLRSIRGASLATLTADGAPLASLTALATMPDGAPILLLSRLAAHTRHLERDGRCSLLLAEGGKGDPLAHPRLSLVGAAAPAGDHMDAARTRFLARNPKARLYVDFPDFSFWIVRVAEGHLNGGFARAASFDAAALTTPTADCAEMIAGESAAATHMNDDHAEAVGRYATVLLGLPEAPWRISGLDPEGVDLVAGDLTGRLRFPHPVGTRLELRRALVALAESAHRAVS